MADDPKPEQQDAPEARHIPIIIVDANDVELFSGEFHPVEGRNPILVSSSVGTAVHQYDDGTPYVKIIIPTIEALIDYTPPVVVVEEAKVEEEGIDLDTEKGSKKK